MNSPVITVSFDYINLERFVKCTLTERFMFRMYIIHCFIFNILFLFVLRSTDSEKSSKIFFTQKQKLSVCVKETTFNVNSVSKMYVNTLLGHKRNYKIAIKKLKNECTQRRIYFLYYIKNN